MTHVEEAAGGGGSTPFAQVVARLALSYADDRPEPRSPLLEQIETGAVTAMPGVVVAAVVILDREGQLTAPSAVGNQMKPRVIAVQNQLGDGPCLDALRNHKQVAVMDHCSDMR